MNKKVLVEGLYNLKIQTVGQSCLPGKKIVSTLSQPKEGPGIIMCLSLIRLETSSSDSTISVRFLCLGNMLVCNKSFD